MDAESPSGDKPFNIRNKNTIASLRLDLEAARKGKTWRLLPEGFRAKECGMTYPLPGNMADLQVLSAIPIPKWQRDSGSTYLRRALAKYRSRQTTTQSIVIDANRSANTINELHKHVQKDMSKLQAEAREAVDKVKVEAERAIAGLNDLFALGRKGMDGIMRAHLEGREWQGEKVGHRSFMACFRMVTQTVGRLGLPTEQRAEATQAVMDQVAESLRETQETISPKQDSEETIQ